MALFSDTVDIAIIGTAGRDRARAVQMDRELYFAMYADAASRIEAIAQKLPIRLISGGAAWADHLSVNLYLKGLATLLVLHFPARFLPDVPGYEEQGGRYDAGRTSNYYHGLFTRAIAHDSLGDIRDALAKGAESHSGGGFHARNRQVAAEAEWLLAYTWGSGSEPADGGTLHTWRASRIPDCRRTHVPLDTLAKKNPRGF